jgi:hypothetical protein
MFFSEPMEAIMTVKFLIIPLAIIQKSVKVFYPTVVTFISLGENK